MALVAPTWCCKTTWITGWVRKCRAKLPVATPDRAAAVPVAIAVLPFVDASGDTAAVYFSDGISEDILNALSHDHVLRADVGTAHGVGQIEQQLGNYDAALDWYERAYRMRDFLLSALHVDPQFRLLLRGQAQSIDGNPRWEALIDKIGIASSA